MGEVMDGQRFDDLARLIGSGATRRRVLAGTCRRLWSLLPGISRLAPSAPTRTRARARPNVASDMPATRRARPAPSAARSLRVGWGSCAGDADCCIGSCIGGFANANLRVVPAPYRPVLPPRWPDHCINGACGSCANDGGAASPPPIVVKASASRASARRAAGDSPVCDASQCCMAIASTAFVSPAGKPVIPCDAGHACCAGFCVGGACVTCKDNGSPAPIPPSAAPATASTAPAPHVGPWARYVLTARRAAARRDASTASAPPADPLERPVPITPIAASANALAAPAFYAG